MPGLTLKLDCDVLEADGGTRTAAVNGAWIATALAASDRFRGAPPLRTVLCRQVAALSVGMVEGEVLLDLNYEEDSKAEVDMNVVKTGRGLFVEVQGTAEHTPFSEDEMKRLMAAADKGIQQLIAVQKTLLGEGVLKKERVPGS